MPAAERAASNMDIPAHLANLLGLPRKPGAAGSAPPTQAPKDTPAASSGERRRAVTSSGTEMAKGAPVATSADRHHHDRNQAKALAEGERQGAEIERARGRAIFASLEAKERPDLAAFLATSTSLSSDEAIATLKVLIASGGGKRHGLAERMATVRIPNPGSDPNEASSQDSPQGLAAAILRAGAKSRGELR